MAVLFEITSPTKRLFEAELSVKIATLCGAPSWLTKATLSTLLAGSSTFVCWNFMSLATIWGPEPGEATAGDEPPDPPLQAASPTARASGPRIILMRFMVRISGSA